MRTRSNTWTIVRFLRTSTSIVPPPWIDDLRRRAGPGDLDRVFHLAAKHILVRFVVRKETAPLPQNGIVLIPHSLIVLSAQHSGFHLDEPREPLFIPRWHPEAPFFDIQRHYCVIFSSFTSVKMPVEQLRSTEATALC